MTMLSVAAAADLPRKEPPPPVAAPIGKYPIGKALAALSPQPGENEVARLRELSDDRRDLL
jgi:hypothetical protein